MTIVVTLPGPAGFTFLQLVQRLRIEVAANGSGPASVLNQTGEYERIVKAIADADVEIQQKHDNWKFMVQPFGLETIVGVNTYPSQLCDPPINDLRIWKDRTIKAYLKSAGKSDERFLTYIDYEQWDALYNTGAQTPSQPCHWSVGDEMELLIGPAPADVYVITGKYQRQANRMLYDTDRPIFPAEFHEMVVFLAMMDYGRQTGATEVYQDGQRKYLKVLSRMERTQLPRLNAFRPLA